MDLRNKTKTVIRSLLISSPKSLTISNLDSDYTKFEGHAIPFAGLGYQNLKQFLLSIPDVLTISQSGDIIPVTLNSRSYHIHKFVESNASANFNRYNDAYRYRPRPHPRIKIDYSFRDRDHESNVKPVQETEFVRGDRNALKTIESPPIVDDVVAPKQVQIEEQKDIRRASDEGVDDESALPFVDDDDPVLFIGLGLQLSKIGGKIPSPPLTAFKSGRTYGVFVTEINRMSKFWFTLCSSKAEFDLMEEQLRSHDNDQKRLTLNPFEMVTGYACLVAYKTKVLRAEFLEQPVNDKVKVCFVDYGTVDAVHISDCSRIDRYFAAIPKLCYPGALELEPIKSGIARESALVQRFCKMVQDKPLCGYVTQVDRRKNSVRMVLIDTSDDKKDVIVNRELLAF